MGEGFWSFGCRNDVEFKSYKGLGSYLRSRFGEWWVGGGVYQKFAAIGYECRVQPFIGAPVKAYGWIAEMNYGKGCWGQWFENGAIGYHDGAWRVMYGDFGQRGGMTLASLKHKMRRRNPRPNAEIPPDAPGVPPAPL